MEFDRKKKVRRTHYIINRGFQFRYIGVLVGSGLLASCIVGGILYYIVEINWMLQLDTGLSLFPEAKKLLALQRNWIVLNFLGCLLFLSGILSLWGVFLSHRIAGPVFALGRRMADIVEKYNLMTPLQFRKKDALHPLKDEFNDILKTVQKTLTNEIQFWGDMKNNLEQKAKGQVFFEGEYRSILKTIDGYIKDKEKWLTSENGSVSY